MTVGEGDTEGDRLSELTGEDERVKDGLAESEALPDTVAEREAGSPEALGRPLKDTLAVLQARKEALTLADPCPEAEAEEVAEIDTLPVEDRRGVRERLAEGLREAEDVAEGAALPVLFTDEDTAGEADREGELEMEVEEEGEPEKVVLTLLDTDTDPVTLTEGVPLTEAEGLRGPLSVGGREGEDETVAVIMVLPDWGAVAEGVRRAELEEEKDTRAEPEALIVLDADGQLSVSQTIKVVAA